MSYRERISDVIVTIEVEGFEPEPCAALGRVAPANGCAERQSTAVSSPAASEADGGGAK